MRLRNAKPFRLLAADVRAAKWNLIFPRGEWHGANLAPLGGSVDLTDEVLAAMVANWKAAGSPALPITFHHVEIEASPGVAPEELKKAAGWYEDLRVTEAGLEGLTRWTPNAAARIEADEYRFVSPEWTNRATDRRTGEPLGWWLYGAALLNDPFFHEQPRVAASHAAPTGAAPMDKKMLCAALGMPEDSTDEAIVAKCKALCGAAKCAAEETEKVKAALVVESDAKVTAALAPVKEALALATAAAAEAKTLAAAKDAEILTLKATAKKTERETFLASLVGYGAVQRVAVGKYLDAMGIEEARAFAASMVPAGKPGETGVTGSDLPPDVKALKAEFDADLDASIKAGAGAVAASNTLRASPKFAPLFAVR